MTAPVTCASGRALRLYRLARPRRSDAETMHATDHLVAPDSLGVAKDRCGAAGLSRIEDSHGPAAWIKTDWLQFQPPTRRVESDAA